MFSEMPLLSLVIWLPIVGGAIVLAAANIAGNNVVRWLSLAFAALTLVVSLPLYTQFDAAATKMQFEELAPWIKAFNINYHLGIAGISLLLILLTSFTTVLVIISAWEVIQYTVAQYMVAFLYLFYQSDCFSILDYLKLPDSMTVQGLLCIAFLLAFTA